MRRRTPLLAMMVVATAATGILRRPVAPGGTAEAAALARPGAAPPAESLGWFGTVEVDAQASGPVVLAGQTVGSFTGAQHIRYALHGDGTADFDARISDVQTLSTKGLSYTIPTTGSGAGMASAEIGFDGRAWNIDIEPQEGIPVATDYTDRDAVLSRAMGDLAVLLNGGQRPAVQSDITSGSDDNFLYGLAADRAPADAMTLSGSRTDRSSSSEAIGGFQGLPMTVTTTWHLTRGPVAPHVRIYGPACGCLSGTETERTLHFIAGAAPAGGEFTEFTVTSDGRMPQVDGNQGGPQASVDITGTKDTGTVTLKVAYERGGVRTESEPITVTFCRIDQIQLPGNQHDLSFDLHGNLTVKASATAWRAGQDVSDQLTWDIEHMGGPTVLVADPASRTGDHVAFTYRGMPRKNADFGPKRIRASLGGACPCTVQQTVRAFYPDVASTHPDDVTMPNWFYYWKQTSAVARFAGPLLRYQPTISAQYVQRVATGAKAVEEYDGLTGLLFVSDAVMEAGACQGAVTRTRPHTRTGRPEATGIDCFAEDMRHEMQHRQDFIDWWGSPAGPWAHPSEAIFLDLDDDNVPNSVESGYPGCSRVSKFSCDDRPSDNLSDAEIRAYYQGWTWPLGSADKEDWSCGEHSKQWGGTSCGG